MKTTITRRFEIDYGHRLVRHGGKCKNIHGHRGIFEVTLAGPALNDQGFVVDFAVVKEKIGFWLDHHWDHAFLVDKADETMRDFLINENMKHSVIPVPPTIENLVEILFHAVDLLTKDDVELGPMRLIVTKVKGWETPNCFAETTWPSSGFFGA